MKKFAEILSSRPANEIVLVCGDENLTAERGAESFPSLKQVSADDPLRLALCLRSPVHLVEILSAYDGFADAFLMLDSGLPADVVAAMSEVQRCRLIISDRADIPGAVCPSSVLLKRRGGGSAQRERRRITEWIMTTSGTTGLPKAVSHNLQSLSRTVRRWNGASAPPVWGLAYEPTRFAGMQVMLQAILGGGKLIAPHPDCAGFDQRIGALATGGCTHLSATPTFWRRVLMHPASAELDLRQLTLGGEIADQAILDALKVRFPLSRVTHIYASTEAGVGFSVKDGREGFPLDYVTSGVAGAELKIEEGHLWVRQEPPLSSKRRPVLDEQCFIDTLDSVAVKGDRVFFLGRDTGVINVGGAKVYPERVEQVINAMPEVTLARVISKRNPFSGAVLVAEVIPATEGVDAKDLQARIVRHCRSLLPIEAVPALVRVCTELAVNGSGKIIRI